MLDEVTINKPTGEETYKVLCAFQDEESGNKYLVLDSGKKDSNQNVITYIYKIVDENLEYVEDDEWVSVKKNLISIVKGEVNYD